MNSPVKAVTVPPVKEVEKLPVSLPLAFAVIERVPDFPEYEVPAVIKSKVLPKEDDME